MSTVRLQLSERTERIKFNETFFNSLKTEIFNFLVGKTFRDIEN